MGVAISVCGQLGLFSNRLLLNPEFFYLFGIDIGFIVDVGLLEAADKSTLLDFFQYKANSRPIPIGFVLEEVQ